MFFFFWEVMWWWNDMLSLVLWKRLPCHFEIALFIQYAVFVDMNFQILWDLRKQLDCCHILEFLYQLQNRTEKLKGIIRKSSLGKFLKTIFNFEIIRLFYDKWWNYMATVFVYNNLQTNLRHHIEKCKVSFFSLNFINLTCSI